MTKIYDVGVVGAGKIASSAHLPVLHNIDNVRIKYVADIDKSRAKRMGRSYGAKGIEISDTESLPESDVALLAVPVTVREPYINEFGSRGTAIFSEKPFALNPEEHRQFLARAEAISCNYMRVCFGSTQRAREVVQAEMFGPVERIVCHEGGIQGATGQSSSGFRGEERLRDRQMLLDRSCHGLSQLLYAFPEGDISVDESEMMWERGFDVDLQAELSLSYDGRDVPVHFEITQVRPIESIVRIEFENAVVEFPTEEPGAQLSVIGKGESEISIAFESHQHAASTFAQAVYLRWKEFLSSLSDGGDSARIETGTEITDVMTDMYELAIDSRKGV